MKLLLLPLLAGLAAARDGPGTEVSHDTDHGAHGDGDLRRRSTTTPFSGFPVEVLETTMTITTLQPFESAPQAGPAP